MRPQDALSLLACPRCRGALEADRRGAEREPRALRCAACPGEYPVRFGIPDLRLEPDPWIGVDEEIAKIERILARAAGGGFAALVRAYWEETPGTPARLARRYERSVVRGVERERELLGRLPLPGSGPGARRVLEIGCGTAPLAAAAELLGMPAAGVDVALRWLVLAKARSAEAGTAPLLVAASAGALPFRDGSFGIAAGLDLLDHLRAPDRALAECRRAVAAGGILYLSSPNRYALTPEAHTGIVGLGWLPSSAQGAVARVLRRGPFRETFPLGARAAGRLVRRAGFRDVVVRPEPALPSDGVRLGPRAARWLPLYERLRGWGPTRGLLLSLGPLFEVIARAPEGSVQGPADRADDPEGEIPRGSAGRGTFDAPGVGG